MTRKKLGGWDGMPFLAKREAEVLVWLSEARKVEGTATELGKGLGMSAGAAHVLLMRLHGRGLVRSREERRAGGGRPLVYFRPATEGWRLVKAYVAGAKEYGKGGRK